LLLNKVRVWLATPSVRTSSTLLLIPALFIWNVRVWKPATFFGRYQDDASYFSSGPALARHQGYILTSFPGVPLQPKYPVLYPLLLSGVCKAWPEFPNNVIWVIRLTECFGCLALLCTFFLLRCVAGQGRVPPPILTVNAHSILPCRRFAIDGIRRWLIAVRYSQFQK